MFSEFFFFDRGVVMRIKKNRQGEAMLPDMPGVLKVNPCFHRKDWAAIFGRDCPIHLEIGMGKGDFILAMAAKERRVDFVGMERSLTVMHIAAKKMQKKHLPNLRLLPADADMLDQYFPPGRVERIYLNFSDPWPKRRHASRRLTTGDKLKVYRRVLAPGGQIHLKTDQEPFFDFSLGELIREGWSVGKVTRDLHRSGIEGNVFTEYERRFASSGLAIYRLEAYK